MASGKLTTCPARLAPPRLLAHRRCPPSFCLHLCGRCCFCAPFVLPAASEPGACAAQATGSRGASGGATTSSSTSASAWPRRATPSSASAPAPAPAPSAVHPRPGMRPLRGDAPAESGALAQVQAAAGGLLRVPAPRQGGNPYRPPRAVRPHFRIARSRNVPPLSACRSRKCGLSPARLPVQIARNNAIRQQADRIATGQTDDHGHGHGGH